MTPTATQATSWRWQVFIATWFSYVGFYATRKVFTAVKGPMKAALDVDDLGVSHLWTTYLVCYMLGQFLSATLSRRFANRTLLIAGMSTSIVCTVAMGALLRMGPSAYGPLFVVMAVHGFAQATGWPCNVGLLASWTARRQRGRLMALWGTCYQLGSVGGRSLAGHLCMLFGLSHAYWGAAVVLGVILVVFAVCARESPEKHGLPAVDDDAPEHIDDPSSPPHPPTRVMTIVVAMGAIYFAFKFLRYAFDSWSALIIAEHFKLPTDTANDFATAFDWVGFLGVLGAGWASDRFFRSRRVPVMLVMAWGAVVAAIFMAQFGLVSVWSFAVALGAMGFMCSGPDSLLAGSAAMDLGSRRQAALAAGIVNGCGSVGPIVQEPVIGWLKSTGGDERVLVLVLAMAVAAALAMTLFALRLRAANVRL